MRSMGKAVTAIAAAVWTVLVAAAEPARAAGFAELRAKAEAAMAHAAKAGKQPVPAADPAQPHPPTAAEKQRGFVVFTPPIGEPFEDRRPAAAEVRDAVEIQAAPGETESFLLAVHALADLGELAWSIRGPAPSGVRVEFLPVAMAPMARRRSDKYRVVGLWLADGGTVDVPKGHSRTWLVRIRVAPAAKPGRLSVRPCLAAKGRGPQRVGPDIRLRVLPFGLADPWRRKYVFGAFCAGADFSEAQYREMKDHGLEAVLWFWGHYGLDVRNEGGKLRMDFAALDRTVERFRKAGLRGPVALALGNDSCGHFERAVCQAFKLPMQPQVARRGKTVQLAVLNDPRIERLLVEALRQLFDHARANRWPEIVVLPYDEPTERLMDEHRRMVRLFRKHFPKVRLYGVTMDRLPWAEMVLDTDILVANGDFARIRRLASDRGKAAWFYGSVTTAQGHAGCRWRYGLRTYAYQPDGMWFWCYNFTVGDPWNDFDGHTPDSAWVICWPPLKPGAASVETLAYEGLREAVDDVRYAMTLEAALANAGASPAAGAIRDQYAKWRRALQGARPDAAQLPRYRAQLIQWILALQTAR